MTKWRGVFFAVCLLLLVTTTVAQADTGTITVNTQVLNDTQKVVKISWVSDAAGEVWGSIGEVLGKIWAVVTNPGDGTAAPTDNYDAYLKDYELPATSLVSTQLENRDTLNSEFTYLSADVRLYRPVGFSVSAAGATNEGECWLYVEVPR